MAKAEKYRYTFSCFGFQDCTVRFEFEGFTGTSTTLVASDRPFILREFNNDDNIFKPLRPQLAEMSFIASSSGVSIDDFLMNSDDDIIVYFDFGAYTNYWSGYLLQDDFQETWIDTDHIITLRATEGIGQLKNFEIKENGDELNGKYTPLDLIKYAMADTVQDFTDFRVFNNLFHSSMDDSSTETGLDQCYVNSKTFMINPSQYDDCYTALEKINKSWNQTLFMYNGKWVIIRAEELNIPFAENLRGFRENATVRTAISERYDALVGVDEEIKPISPEMLRFIQRRTKSDTVQFNYDQFDEVVCNGSFSRGDLVTETSTVKTYELDEWNWFQGGINSSTVPTTGSFGRIQQYTALGRLEDQYAFLTQDSTNTRFLKSCGTEVLKNEKINISVETKYKDTFAGIATLDTVVVMLYGVTNNWTLDDDGKWYQSNSTWSTNLKTLQIYYNGTDGILPEEYNQISVSSNSIPEDGVLYISLYCPNTPYSSGQERHFKSLNVTLETTFNGIETQTITGVQSIFTKSDKLMPTFFDEIYFDDGVSKLYKGSIYESDQSTLTDPTWYRYRYSAEEFGYRKQNAIAHWGHNRFNRNKIDVNFFGLTFDSGKPIGLINTIKFVDDDPDRVYWIANLKEIDFSNNVWSATLVEVWDDNKDSDSFVIRDFEAEPTSGNYLPTGEFVLPFTVISAADFTYNGTTKKFTYNGSISLTDLFICNITGDINSISPTPPQEATFRLYINDSQVAFVNYDATVTPSEYSISLNGTYTINPNDNLYVTISSNVGDFDINGGELSVSYEYPGTLTYDPYQDKFIYK